VLDFLTHAEGHIDMAKVKPKVKRRPGHAAKAKPKGKAKARHAAKVLPRPKATPRKAGRAPAPVAPPPPPVPLDTIYTVETVVTEWQVLKWTDDGCLAVSRHGEHREMASHEYFSDKARAVLEKDRGQRQTI
jgi:hypothetical protein